MRHVVATKSLIRFLKDQRMMSSFRFSVFSSEFQAAGWHLTVSACASVTMHLSHADTVKCQQVQNTYLTKLQPQFSTS